VHDRPALTNHHTVRQRENHQVAVVGEEGPQPVRVDRSIEDILGHVLQQVVVARAHAPNGNNLRLPRGALSG